METQEGQRKRRTEGAESAKRRIHPLSLSFSTIVSSQNCACEPDCSFIFHLRNHSDLLEGVIREYLALIDAKSLMAMYRAAVERPYGFLYVNLLAKGLDHMFYSSFLSRFVPSQLTNSSGSAGGIE